MITIYDKLPLNVKTACNKSVKPTERLDNRYRCFNTRVENIFKDKTQSYIELTQSAFIPNNLVYHGDFGTIQTKTKILTVQKVMQYNGIILHQIEGINDLKVGDTIRGVISTLTRLGLSSILLTSRILQHVLEKEFQLNERGILVMPRINHSQSGLNLYGITGEIHGNIKKELGDITKSVKKIIDANHSITHKKVEFGDIKIDYASTHDVFLQFYLNDSRKDSKVSILELADIRMLCEGPHVLKSTEEIFHKDIRMEIVTLEKNKSCIVFTPKTNIVISNS